MPRRRRTRRFGRNGNDLTVRVPVTFAEAALGADIAVPTLDGPPVKLRIKPGTQPGSRHRVKGKGIASQEGHRRPDRHGRRRRADRSCPTPSAQAIEQLAAATAGVDAAASSEAAS